MADIEWIFFLKSGGDDSGDDFLIFHLVLSDHIVFAESDK